MSFNTFNNHPLIPNSNQYFYEKKYISIHSEDRVSFTLVITWYSIAMCLNMFAPSANRCLAKIGPKFDNFVHTLGHSIE